MEEKVDFCQKPMQVNIMNCDSENETDRVKHVKPSMLTYQYRNVNFCIHPSEMMNSIHMRT